MTATPAFRLLAAVIAFGAGTAAAVVALMLVQSVVG
jgi:hypothetical protein